MNHVGVLAALYERKMLPRIISGTSAGSIVAGVCCTRIDDELPQILNDFIHGNLNVFQDSMNPETIYVHIARLLKIGTHIYIPANDRRLVRYSVFDKGHEGTGWRSYIPRGLCACSPLPPLTLEPYASYLEHHSLKCERL